MNFPQYLLVALSLSIGWGIRGNFGHEWGAAMPGALAAMALVLVSGREDWRRRIAMFGAFGAVGWMTGGMFSYMHVIGYTHSGDSLSVWYGFICLFILGFLWAAPGGMATAFPAVLNRERLAEFFAPLAAIFLAFWAKDTFENRVIAVNSDYRQNDPLYWYDTHWLSVSVVIVTILAYCLFRRRIDRACSLFLHMAIGWWVGFLGLTVLLGLHMTPPRSDNWSGSIGMVAGMFAYLLRERMTPITLAALVSGTIGGLGFAGAALLKLVFMKTGWATNWHSFLEQSYGFINGIGIAAAMAPLVRRSPEITDELPSSRWINPVCVSFLLLLLTYMNLQQLPQDWVKAKAVPNTMYFMSAQGWFDLCYAAIAIVILWMIREHLRRPLPFVPADWLGKGQLLYGSLLWWIVIGNLFKAIVRFTPERLITEGTIHFNALICAILAVSVPFAIRAISVQGEGEAPAELTPLSYSPFLRKGAMAFLVSLILSPLAFWGITRVAYGNARAGYSGLHIRFGPNATAISKKPKANAPHP